jgi:hypothetical protein
MVRRLNELVAIITKSVERRYQRAESSKQGAKRSKQSADKR